MKKIIAVAGCVAALLATNVALAAPTDRAPTAVRLDLTQVDFQNPASAKRFYVRLKLAARAACDSRLSDRTIQREDRACMQQAVRRAVEQLSRPTLTAMYAGERSEAFASGY